MTRIGIFGGTFNPIHLGHLIIAQKVLENLDLKRIIFVPCYIPAHKSKKKLVDAQDRFKMVSLAIEGNSRFKVSSWEIKQKATSYTIDTLKHFKNKLGKNALLFFIIGSDSLKELMKWKDVKGILKLVRLVVVNRPGYNFRKLPRGFIKVSIPGIDISSSLIRKRLSQSKSVDYFLSDKVSEYIKKKRLYV
ncbi:MAG: nicotinate-nucleotide adenylyltransferase [Candidatus Omnitrophota bacterium]|nr:nicotinate-nucleotide adenylyltransferase [Candidatus Omnitrophota bacterium]